jgi:YYY domain-containing protein
LYQTTNDALIIAQQDKNIVFSFDIRYITSIDNYQTIAQLKEALREVVTLYMFELLKMWAVVEVLGLLCLPLTVMVFHNLPDRGWAFSKALGLTVFAFVVWLPLMYFQTLPYSQPFLLGMALLLAAASIMGFLYTYDSVMKVIRGNKLYVVVAELTFLVMVLLMGILRQFRPDIRSWETFMDEGIIAGIMRSPHLPPNDIWYSGYSINYYYYAHFMMATLGKLIGQAPSIVFNTGLSILFGLTALNLFGVSSNVVAWARHARISTKLSNQSVIEESDPSDQVIIEPLDPSDQAVINDSSTSDQAEIMERPSQSYPALRGAIPFGFCSLIMGVIFGNLASAQQWWAGRSSYPGAYEWFYPSRVIPGTINEFPAFSFLLSDFHAHVLTLAFTILAIGVAFNLLLEKDGSTLRAFGRGWQIPCTLLGSALMIGQLFVMNGWDLPTYLGLALVAIALQRWLSYGQKFRFMYLFDVILSWISLVGLTVLLFLPFYKSYIVPTGGIGLLKETNRSAFNLELLIYGFFLFVFISLLVVGIFQQSLLARIKKRRYEFLMILLTVILVNSVILIRQPNSLTFVVLGDIALISLGLVLYYKRDRALAFTLFAGALACILIAACEIVYLRDLFESSEPRLNTVFKFYFQAWTLLSIACGCGLFFIFDSIWRAVRVKNKWRFRISRGIGVLWTAGLIALVLASLIYPIIAPAARLSTYDAQTGTMAMQPTWSLDGMTYLKNCRPPDAYPDSDSDPVMFCLTDVTHDYNAIRWINANIQGDPVMVEAADFSVEDYSLYALVSTFTGLPTPMGWPGHEVQWRNGWLKDTANSKSFNRRMLDIDTIYRDPSPQVVLSLMKKYNAQYLYVGSIEHAKYGIFSRATPG